MILFHKYTAIGNDYLVLDSRKYPLPSKEDIARVCNRHLGIGSDGLLWGGTEQKGYFPLKIFNPDASEAEKSGNGIRIFARFLWDKFYATAPFLTVRVPSGEVLCHRHEADLNITVAMGIPQWSTPQLPSPCDQTIELNGQPIEIHAVSMGNPHVVICSPPNTLDDILHYGPLLERHPLFLEKTNVQMIHVRDNHTIAMRIWERGVGHTLASGSSACAAFAVARKLNLCGSMATVHMPGGKLEIRCDITGAFHQTGPVTHIADCQWHNS
jgi:diaminopimelate epimerase